jgi:hypothetical protein
MQLLCNEGSKPACETLEKAQRELRMIGEQIVEIRPIDAQ